MRHAGEQRNGTRFLAWTAILALVTMLSLREAARAEDDPFFASKVAPLLEKHCLSCHDATARKGGFSLATGKAALAGGKHGVALVPGKPDASSLIEMISGNKPKMPRKAAPLAAEQVAILRTWIERGAVWPEELVLEERKGKEETWWSLRPIVRPSLPVVKKEGWGRNPIDAFILSRLERQGLAPNPEASRLVLIRRLTFDLLGLPPTPEEVDAFLRDPASDAYEKLVDRLLASPHYGERWARHWLDVVHYGDTHGFDKDQLRPHAWHYRDYIIQSFNDDKPYDRFVEEQLAGDVLYPGTPNGSLGLGFLAAGPWDLVGQTELREGTLDKKITRNLDRDDMVATTMNTFTSLTVQCARCHNHKFDPISQEDYYSLQAVFAAIDRADRPFDLDPNVAKAREDLRKSQQALAARQREMNIRIGARCQAELKVLDDRIAVLRRQALSGEQPEFGYHSKIEAKQDLAKWVQIDLGKPTSIASIVLVGCHDTFNGIGAGFGFPVRYRLEIALEPDFKQAEMIADLSQADAPNPGVKPQTVKVEGKRARYVRLTATKLAPRANDFIFALAELSVITPEGVNVAANAPVSALDSIEAPPRWRKANLVDGYYYGVAKTDRTVKLISERQAILEKASSPDERSAGLQLEKEFKELSQRLAALPPQQLVYAAASEFAGQGSFQATGGKPRPIHLLRRGSENSPVREIGPGTVSCLPELGVRFPADQGEGARRVALARWITDKRNPLPWRSIVNRVWQYHFGRGIVDSPNDFGKMGGAPSHPELLDWLAAEFRDGGRSLKSLHRLIVTSATYRQSSAHHEVHARADGGNQYLWRMNRRRLEAEAIRDSVLMVSGKLNLKLHGEGFKPFGFQADHSPRYLYEEYDPDNPLSHRRSIYRFLVRSVPEPFLESLDCADPSLIVDKRNETITALQALALLNDKFMVRMAEHYAARVQKMGTDDPSRIAAAYRLAFGRLPTPAETTLLTDCVRKHGLANVCRMILNTNEFSFAD